MKNSRTMKAGLLSIGQILVKILGYVLFAVLARVFSEDDNGLYRQTIMQYSFLMPVFILGVPQAIYFFMANQPNRKRNVLVNNIIALTASGVLLAAFLWFFGADFFSQQFNSPELAKTLRIIGIQPLFVFPIMGLTASLLVNNKAKIVVVYSLISSIVPSVMILAAVFIWRTPSAGIAGSVAGNAVIFMPLVWLLIKSVDTGNYRPDWKGIKDQVKFAVPFGLSEVVICATMYIDKNLVATFFDRGTFAVYITGAMEIPIIGFITGSATMVLLSDISVMLSDGKKNEALELWKRAATKCGMIIIPAMGFFMVAAPEIMSIVFSEKYVESADPFRIYLLLLPARIAYFKSFYIGAGKTRLAFIRSIVGLLLNLGLSYLLIKTVGLLGAAIATVLVTYIWVGGFNLMWAKKYFSCRVVDIFPLVSIFKLLLGACIAGGISFCIATYFKEWIPLFRVCLIGSIYLIVLVVLYQLIGVISIRSVIRLIQRKAFKI